MLIILGGVGSVIALGDSLKRMNAAHDPLLDLNEFASGKNGSLHPQPHPHPHPQASTVAAPGPPVESVSTLANRVMTNITKADEKYGGEGDVVVKITTSSTEKDTTGKGMVAGERSKVDSKATTEGNKKLEKGETLGKKLGSPSTVGGSNKGKDLGNSSQSMNTTSAKNVKVNSKATVPQKSNSASPPASSTVINKKVPVRHPSKMPLSPKGLRAFHEEVSPSPLPLRSVGNKEMPLPVSSIRYLSKHTTPSLKSDGSSANEKVPVIAEEGDVVKEENSELVKSSVSQHPSHEADKISVGSAAVVPSSPLPPENSRT